MREVVLFVHCGVPAGTICVFEVSVSSCSAVVFMSYWPWIVIVSRRRLVGDPFWPEFR
jgi:hypothetical protein